MTFKTIRIQRDGPIATGTLTRPDRLNAFGYEMMEEVTEAARIFRKDHDAHAIVLPGEKRAFSSGFDLTQSSPSGSVAQRREHHHSGAKCVGRGSGSTSFMDADVSMLVFHLDDALKAREPFKARAAR